MKHPMNDWHMIHHFCNISYCLWNAIREICSKLCESNRMIILNNNVNLFMVNHESYRAPAFTIMYAGKNRSFGIIFLIPGQQVFDCVIYMCKDKMDRKSFYEISERLLSKISSDKHAVPAAGRILIIKKHDTGDALESSFPEEVPRHILDRIVESVEGYCRAPRIKYFYYKYLLRSEINEILDFKNICEFLGFVTNLSELCNCPDRGVETKDQECKFVLYNYSSCKSQSSFILNDFIFLCYLLRRFINDNESNLEY